MSIFNLKLSMYIMIFLPPMRWLTKRFPPSAAAPASLSHSTIYCGPPVSQFARPCSVSLDLFLTRSFFSTFQMSPATQHMQPTQTLQSPTASGGRRRRVVDEDPDERRRKFLERNRAAATRCRQKRKVWVMSLEKKAEELTQTNMQLQVHKQNHVAVRSTGVE